MHFETDDIIGLGLVISLIIFVSGQIFLAAYDKPRLPMEFAIAISNGLLVYLGKFFMRKENLDDDSKSPTNDRKGNSDC